MLRGTHHHLGQREGGRFCRKANIMAWRREIGGGGWTPSSSTPPVCGTMVKDYGYLVPGDPELRRRAEGISKLDPRHQRIHGGNRFAKPGYRNRSACGAYHGACSLQHGQNHGSLRKTSAEPDSPCWISPEGHLCCGSAGTYNLLQPETREQLRDLKVTAIERSAGNDCRRQYRLHHPDCIGTDIPIFTPSNCWIGRPADQGRRACRRDSRRNGLSGGT